MLIKKKNIHFIGIGGAGMSGIAEVLHNMGHEISGSDLSKSSVTERLRKFGIKIYYSHNAKHIKSCDLVVYSSAIPKENPEMIISQEQKIPILSRGEMLAELMTFKKGIAIAGSHGKTTTTSMLASILTYAKLDPTIVIGGKFLNIDAHAKLGKGDFLIAEVDESDRSFLKSIPIIAAINNIDLDHINMFSDDRSASYNNFDDIIAAFSQFIRQIPILGKIIINKDDEVLYGISKKYSRDYIYYSLKDKKADFFAEKITISEKSTSFILYSEGKKVDKFEINTIGNHNVMNALASISAAYSINVPFKKIKIGLKKFTGVERRMQFLKRDNNSNVIIDYGHHPNEIKETLKALKSAFPKNKLYVIFQPHRFSRTKVLFKEFTECFSNADELHITKIYKASEIEIPGITGQTLAESTPNANYIENVKSLIPEIETFMNNYKSTILFLGAGDIYKYANDLI